MAKGQWSVGPTLVITVMTGARLMSSRWLGPSKQCTFHQTVLLKFIVLQLAVAVMVKSQWSMGSTLVITVLFIINVAFCFAFSFRGVHGFCIRHFESKVCDTASIQLAWCLGILLEQFKAGSLRHLRILPSCYCFRCSVFGVVMGLGSVSAITTASRSTLRRSNVYVFHTSFDICRCRLFRGLGCDWFGSGSIVGIISHLIY